MDTKTCSLDGCEKQVHSKGLCQNHYRQARRLERGLQKPGPKPDPSKERSRHNPTAKRRGASEMRVTTARKRGPLATDEHCSQGHPWNEHTLNHDDRQRYCRYCRYLASRKNQGFEDALDYDQWIAYRERRKTMCKNGHLWAEHGRQNPDGHWICKKCQIDVRRRAVYGIEPEQYDALSAKQDGKCAGCQAVLDDLDVRDVHIDHCHNNGDVRGLLCSKCNMGLGLLMDNPETLRRLAAYVEGKPAPFAMLLEVDP